MRKPAEITRRKRRFQLDNSLDIPRGTSRRRSRVIVSPGAKQPVGKSAASLPAADMTDRIALRLQRTSAATMRMSASSGTCLPFIHNPSPRCPVGSLLLAGSTKQVDR